jgi:hypothetical protein
MLNEQFKPKIEQENKEWVILKKMETYVADEEM